MSSDSDTGEFLHPEDTWVPSTVMEEDLEEMVRGQIFLERAFIQWWLAVGESFPTPNTNEIVIFEHYFYHGFALPTCRFFHGLLLWYGIKLIHLKPNSIFQITIFIHFYEAYLGLCLHFNFFHYLYVLKPSGKGKE